MENLTYDLMQITVLAKISHAALIFILVNCQEHSQIL